MLISRSDLDRRKSGFAWWRMLAWVLLLLAAFGGVQYIHHAQQVWGALQALSAGDEQSASALHSMLAWDLGYLAAAFVVIVACAGCILRQAWARPVLRVVALVLCVWSAYRGVLLWQQWNAFDAANAVLLAGGQPTPAQAAQLGDLRRVLLMGLGLRVAAVPLMLWLAWQLGQPAVRLQFRARRI
jgi:glucan phosphoethanolaminetransferase (alkaline phosphatase superfamily)